MLFPAGLTRQQCDQLSANAERSERYTLTELAEMAKQHVERATRAHARNVLVNVKLAEAIGNCIQDLIGSWDSLPPHSHVWLRSAFHYFAVSNDSEPDFSSAIGFEDDVEILNACVKFAGRAELLINAEDFDDV